MSTNSEQWKSLGQRLQARLRTALDLLSILVSDAVILLGGYAILWIVAYATGGRPLPGEAGKAFHVAEMISAALFLVLYFVLVGFHVYQFLANQLQEHE